MSSTTGIADGRRWQPISGIGEVVNRQSNLLKVIGALHPASGLSGLLDGRQ
jgi:hypothetical protein